MTQEFRNIKIRTNNKEELVAVHKMLIANGCTWVSGDTQAHPYYGLCTFVSPHGLMTHSDDMKACAAQNMGCKEVFVDFEQTLVATLSERPKTVLFGKTYFTDELNARLAGLETAQ